MFEKLMKEVEYAKKAVCKEISLYEALGRIKMARELEAITLEESLTLHGACVRDGINNPKYFDKYYD